MAARRGLVFAALLATACSSKTTASDAGPDGGTCAVASCTGTDNSTCPSQTNYTCQAGCCVFFCLAVSDCSTQACASSALGCVCDLGECQQKVCSEDTDCGAGKVCVAGACESPDTTAAARCVVSPPLFVARTGLPTQLAVTAFDADGGVVRSGVAPTFTVSDGMGSVSATGAFTDSQASTAPADVTVTATVDGVSCTAAGTVYGAASNPQVTVIDANTALPVTDATVQISAAANGTLLGTATVGGDALGRYAISGSTLALGGMVTVFEENYEFASAVAPGFADGGTFGTMPDLIFVLTQTGKLDPVSNAPYTGGYIGDFSKGVGPFSSSANLGAVLLGLAGTAVPEDPANLSLGSLLGPSVTVSIGGAIGQSFPLPVGAEVSFAGENLDCTYEGLGAAGGCGLAVLDGGANPFTCGNRPAWGLGGPIPSSQLESLLASPTAPTLGELLTIAAPAFPSFASGVGFDVPYAEQAPVLSDTVPNSCNAASPGKGTTPIPAPSNLTPFQLQLDTAVDLVADVTLPPLPQLAGACVQTAIVFGGVLSPQVGLLPLGMSAASILNAVGAPDATCLTYDPLNATAADGNIGLHLAPAHGGFEGLPYGVLALAGLDSSTGAVSGLLQSFADLPYDTAVSFSGQQFLGFAQGATYTSASRSFALGAGLVTAPTLYRLRFVEGGGAATGPDGQWAVQVPPGSPPIVLPVPPSPFEDRTVGASANVEALQLSSASATSTQLVDFSNGPEELNLLQEIQAFSSVPATLN